MKTVHVDTFTATIYVGTREQYTPNVRAIEMAREFLHDFVNRVGLCVTLTETEFIYTHSDYLGPDDGLMKAGEPGFIVGLINYPRFPAESSRIRALALEIAEGLRVLFKQFKVTVVFPDETVMVEE